MAGISPFQQDISQLLAIAAIALIARDGCEPAVVIGSKAHVVYAYALHDIVDVISDDVGGGVAFTAQKMRAENHADDAVGIGDGVDLFVADSTCARIVSSCTGVGCEHGRAADLAHIKNAWTVDVRNIDSDAGAVEFMDQFVAPARESVALIGAAAHTWGDRVIGRKMRKCEIGDVPACELLHTFEFSVELVGAFYADTDGDLLLFSGMLPIGVLADASHVRRFAQGIDQIDLAVTFFPATFALPWPVMHAEYCSGILGLLHAGEIAVPEKRLTAHARGVGTGRAIAEQTSLQNKIDVHIERCGRTMYKIIAHKRRGLEADEHAFIHVCHPCAGGVEHIDILTIHRCKTSGAKAAVALRALQH